MTINWKSLGIHYQAVKQQRNSCWVYFYCWRICCSLTVPGALWGHFVVHTEVDFLGSWLAVKAETLCVSENVFPGGWHSIKRNVGEVVTNTTQLAQCPAASSRDRTLFVEVWYLSVAWLKPAPVWNPLTCNFTECSSSYGQAGAAHISWLCTALSFLHHCYLYISSNHLTANETLSLCDIFHLDFGSPQEIFPFIWCLLNQVSHLITTALERIASSTIGHTENWLAAVHKNHNALPPAGLDVTRWTGISIQHRIK